LDVESWLESYVISSSRLDPMVTLFCALVAAQLLNRGEPTTLQL